MIINVMWNRAHKNVIFNRIVFLKTKNAITNVHIHIPKTMTYIFVAVKNINAIMIVSYQEFVK
mgnify:CR=1 FL=1